MGPLSSFRGRWSSRRHVYQSWRGSSCSTGFGLASTAGNKLSVNSKEKGPPPHTQTTLASTYMHSHILMHRAASHVHSHANRLDLNEHMPQIHTKPFITHAGAPKYIPPIVHVWWQMFLYSLFTDTTNPAVCSVQLQDGLTALSNTVIITLHALEESEAAAILDGNHVQLQLNEWRRDIYYWTNQAYWSHSEWTYSEGIFLSVDPKYVKDQQAFKIKSCK